MTKAIALCMALLGLAGCTSDGCILVSGCPFPITARGNVAGGQAASPQAPLTCQPVMTSRGEVVVCR